MLKMLWWKWWNDDFFDVICCSCVCSNYSCILSCLWGSGYWFWRAHIKGVMSLLSGVSSWIKKGWSQWMISLAGVSAFSSLTALALLGGWQWWHPVCEHRLYNVIDLQSLIWNKWMNKTKRRLIRKLKSQATMLHWLHDDTFSHVRQTDTRL